MRLSRFAPPVEQPRPLREPRNPVRSLKHLVLGHTVAAPVLVVEDHEVEHPAQSVKYVNCSGAWVALGENEEQRSCGELNPADDLSLGALGQPAAGFVQADGSLQTEIFECEDGIGGECRRWCVCMLNLLVFKRLSPE